jgi:hypothetical protein
MYREMDKYRRIHRQTDRHRGDLMRLLFILRIKGNYVEILWRINTFNSFDVFHSLLALLHYDYIRRSSVPLSLVKFLGVG